MVSAGVVSGDVRQTAEIAFGDPKSEEYLHLKDYAKNPHVSTAIVRCAWCKMQCPSAEVAALITDPRHDPRLYSTVTNAAFTCRVQRMEHWGWTSNNSVFAKLGMDYEQVAHRVQVSQ